MAEHDLNKLLSLILRKSRKILGADAGSLFLIEWKGNETPTHLRFELSQNDSIEVSLHESRLPINMKSLAGYVALTKTRLLIDDVYNIHREMPYQFMNTFDKTTGYRSKSLLSVPMLDHKHTMIGVIQLWNKKLNPKLVLTEKNTNKEVIPFDESDCFLLESLASQAAIAVENAKLYSDIEQLFEGFIKASVHAIEARDPTTSGHSERVSTLTLALAQEANNRSDGIFKDIYFTDKHLKEIQYASLLHDFGKIGVRESVLVKAKKLYPLELEVIRNHIDMLHQTYRIELLENQVQYLAKGGKKNDDLWNNLERTYQMKVESLQQTFDAISECNEPTVLSKDVEIQLQRLKDIHGKRLDGSTFALVNSDQLFRLSISKGTLSSEERKEIEAHVSHTYEFLKQIPWTSELKNVPDIAHAHHEKLNGTGYPRALESKEIPVASQIMAITDIFDALVARDRPYKKAISRDKALQILSDEARQGMINSDFVDLFIRQKIFLLTTS